MDDMDEYRRRSYTNWQAAAPGWERERAGIQAALRPVTDWMINRLRPSPGEIIVEFGAGTGEVGLEVARLVGPDGRVIVSDRAPGMVEAAARRAAELGLANVEVRTLDLEALDLADASADGALCRLAYMLVPDPGRALAETRRVLRPGGRVAFAVWDVPGRNPWATVLWDVLEQMTDLPPAKPGGPGMFAMADPVRVRELLAEANLRVDAVEQIAIEWTFESFGQYWRSQSAVNGGLVRLLSVLAPEQQEQLTKAVRSAVERFRSPDGYRAPGVALGALAGA